MGTSVRGGDAAYSQTLRFGCAILGAFCLPAIPLPDNDVQEQPGLRVEHEWTKGIATTLDYP